MGEGERLPRHIAVIMDGNGRWAKKRLLPRGMGHRAGLKRMLSLSEYVFDRGVQYCTLYALSAENLSRPQEELNGLYSLFREYFIQHTQTLKEKNITLKVIGDLSLLPSDVKEIIERGVLHTQGGTRGVLTLAIAYGARQEIVKAVNLAIKQGEPVTQESFSALLSTGDIPDPDLFIRTGKELRLSNFLLWQSAYSELYFTEKYFPDFSNEDLEEAIKAYAARERRYGKV